MKLPITLVSIAACALCACATGQNNAENCPSAAAMDARHLQGQWRAELQGQPPALLRLGPHPELAESVRGTVQRGTSTAQAVGDVDDGDLTLEESSDGTRISATWTGRVTEGRCGREIRGTWSSAQAPNTLIPFVLRKQAPALP